MRRCLAVLLAFLAGACTPAPPPPEVLAHGRFTQVTVYRPAREVRQFVLLLSGQKSVPANLTQAARALVHEGAMVAIVNTAELLASLERDRASCVSPDGDLENLSRYVQAYYRLPGYIAPILIGDAEGGTLAYAMIAQAPADLFAGAVSLQFCRDLPLERALCPGRELAATPRADGGGVELAPATHLPVPWIALQIEGQGACPASLTREFVAAVPHGEEISLPSLGHAWATPSSWLAALTTAYQKIAAQSRPQTRAPASLFDLPIIEVPASGTNDLFAVFMSGDGGWAGIDKNVAASLAARGIPVAGVDSLRYFWTARTPQGLAVDLDRILRYYLAHWNKQRVLIMGYSQGADGLAFAVNRLPAATRSRVVLTAMMGLDTGADFEFHVSNWVANGASGVPVRPEIEKLTVPLLCIYGDGDADSLCPKLQGTRAKVVKLAGGHHFNGKYDGVAEVVLADDAIRARAN